MIPSFEQRHALAGRACPHFGGDSSSDASTRTTTTNTDKRLVLDGGATGVSIDGSSGVTLTVTDAGAVKAGTDTANLAILSNATNLDHILAAADKLYQSTQKTLDANTKLAGELAGTAAGAYADAASQASGNKNLVLVAIAAVALIAVVAFSKGR